MKLKYKSISQDSLSSIYVKRVNEPHIGGNWHFHEEYELIYFLKGRGMRIVGDHVSHFQEGELVLVGEWLPHLWRNEVGEDEDPDLDFLVIKFKKNFAGESLFRLPELLNIRKLLEKSSRGILFSPNVLPSLEPILIELSNSKSGDIIINFLRVLQLLQSENRYTLLSSSEFVLPLGHSEENRLQKVLNYISLNYNNAIALDEISSVACLTPPSFCRFFKNSTNKTFSFFLNEVRVRKACQLLINGEQSINQICYDTGFNSLTSFNRTFKTFKELTPSQYRKSYSIFRK
jgi:AraC-like DNA-binding protein